MSNADYAASAGIERRAQDKEGRAEGREEGREERQERDHATVSRRAENYPNLVSEQLHS